MKQYGMTTEDLITGLGREIVEMQAALGHLIVLVVSKQAPEGANLKRLSEDRQVDVMIELLEWANATHARLELAGLIVAASSEN